MKPNFAKERAFQQHVSYMYVIHFLGKVVMLVNQIQAYMAHFQKKSKDEVWKDLRDLQNAEVVDIHKFHNNSYVKLKKFAIRIIRKKARASEVKALNVTDTLLMRSVHINAFLISQLKASDTNLVTYINTLLKDTTLIAKEKMGFNILVKYKSDPVIHEELVRLNNIYKGLPTKSYFTLNNMASRACYVTRINDESIHVAMFDFNSNMTPKRAKENLTEIYTYLSSLFPKKELHVFVLARDIVHLEILRKKLLKVKPTLRVNIKLHVASLDITSKYLSNVKLI